MDGLYFQLDGLNDERYLFLFFVCFDVDTECIKQCLFSHSS